MFQVTSRDRQSEARAGTLQTAHGAVRTPAFMPVGTQGTVKTLTVQDLVQCGIEMVLGNVYHLSLRPGQEILQAAGGLHRFMGWDRAILTDSGGYQVFSLAAKAKVTDEGVAFASHVDGSLHRLTPESVIEFQLAVGSDVVIPLDECVRFPCERPQAEEAIRRTAQWAERSKRRFNDLKGSDPGGSDPRGSDPGGSDPSRLLLFGIVQGATYPDLRKQAAERLLGIGFDGYAIGGFSVGEPKELLFDLLPGVTEQLPRERPRYLMGMGEPLDLVEAVEAGVDLFDCVIPTRHGRNGVAYTWGGRLNLRNAAFARDPRPVDPECACEACRGYSRMYLRHLFQVEEILALRLLSFHNVWFYSTLMARIRQAIADGNLGQLHAALKPAYQETLEGMVE